MGVQTQVEDLTITSVENDRDKVKPSKPSVYVGMPHWPVYEHQAPTDPKKALDEEIENLNMMLANKELLKLCVIEHNLNDAYCLRWVKDSNKIYNAAVRLMIRRRTL